MIVTYGKEIFAAPHWLGKLINSMCHHRQCWLIFEHGFGHVGFDGGSGGSSRIEKFWPRRVKGTPTRE